MLNFVKFWDKLSFGKSYEIFETSQLTSRNLSRISFIYNMRFLVLIYTSEFQQPHEILLACLPMTGTFLKCTKT